MGRSHRSDPDLTELDALDDVDIPDVHVVRRFLATHEPPPRAISRRQREHGARRRRSTSRSEAD